MFTVQKNYNIIYQKQIKNVEKNYNIYKNANQSKLFNNKYNSFS